MTDYTMEALKRQIDGGMTMRDLSEIFPGVGFPELYQDVKNLSGSRVIRAGDAYWYDLVQGQTISAISKKTGVMPDSIVKAIEKSGYDLDAVEESDDYGFTLMMPSRLVLAWKALGNRAMTYLRMVVDEAKEIVDAGTPIVRMRLPEEERELLSLPLTPKDFETIDYLNQHSISRTGSDHIPVRHRSKIVRALISQMVESMPELVEFRAKDLSYAPPANYLGATWATTFNAPVYLWKKAEQLKGSRGQSAPNLSSLMRDVIQDIIEDPGILDEFPDPVGYTQPPKFNALFAEDGEEWRFNQPVLTITLLEEQKASVQAIRLAKGWGERGGHSIFMCKALAIVTGLQQDTLPGWAEYLEFVQKSWGGEDRPVVRQHLERMNQQGFVVNIQAL